MKTSTKAILILSVLLTVSIVLLCLKNKPEVITNTVVEYVEVAYKDTSEYNELIQKYDSLGNVIYELQKIKPPVHTVYIEKPIYLPGEDSIIVECNVINTYQDTLTDSNSVEIYRITTLGYLMEYQRDLKINYPIVTNTIINDAFYTKWWFSGGIGFLTGFYLGSR